MNFICYRPEYREPMLALHRSAIEGFALGMTEQQDEADLLAIEDVYLRNGGEFLLGWIGERLVAMGGFKRLPGDQAELRRMRIARDLQGRGYGTLLLQELESKAYESGVRELSLNTARRRPLTLQFYRKHGYQEIGHGFYGSIETVQFVKILDERVRKRATAREQVILLRNSKREELSHICDLEQSEARNFIIPYSLERHLEEFAKSGMAYKSIWRSDRLIGFLILALDSDARSLEFRRIVISDAGRGYGKRVVPMVDAICRYEFGRTRIWLDVFETNERARHLYEQCGYHGFGKSEHQGRTLLLYEKTI